MQSLWRDDEAAGFDDELGLRVYTSRLLGREPTLVLHGGGNTSVKLPVTNRFGETEDVLFVKGSGWDLATIEPAGFTPVRLAAARRLARLDTLSDPDMVAELAVQVTRAGAPAPSVETLLHALLPYRYVDHTHADAILAMTHTADGEQRVRKLFGNRVVIIPYVMPGFDLAKYVAREFDRQASRMTVGMVLMNHGLFTFGATARESYERTIELVDGAERYLARNGAGDVTRPRDPAEVAPDPLTLARLRARISRAARAPLILRTKSTTQTVAFASDERVARLVAEGPSTPDHAIRTKRVAMVGDDVDGYVARYGAYFADHTARSGIARTMLDPAPRVVVDPRFGLACAGRTVGDARIVEELFENTIDVMLRADALGGYIGLAPAEVFDVEYWDLEQAKLKRGGRPPVFQGEVALVTGAASGIGKATVDALLARGAAVVGIDRDPTVAHLRERADFLGIEGDVTHEATLVLAIERAARAFGGIDMLVLNAGVFPSSRAINALDADAWRGTMGVNVDANLALLRLAHPFLALAPNGGRVVVIGSKNVPAPGPGAAAYSASKAALAQLARVAALEWGADGIRINTLHPNAVFDTGLWSDQVLAERASRYGLTVDEYKRNNVLRTEVTSRDVAELAAEMLGPLFAKTTGAQLPVDGGNDRVI
jgi:rhamnose utilization protein RhaD (predicted bifunctional aldolase and dehydrogenase)/NAD(P)-dependent dehydrogenase (short-subunit alcohol dehydrogenase family)